VTDDKGDVPAAAEFLMTNDCRVGSVSTVSGDRQPSAKFASGVTGGDYRMRRYHTRSIIMSTMLFIYGLSYDPFPGGHYIHPFHEKTYGYLEDEGKEHPRTVRFPFVTSRLCDLTGRLLYLQVVGCGCCALSNAIREKPYWWEKIKEPALVEKWTQEALDQQRGEYRIRQLTRRMIKNLALR